MKHLTAQEIARACAALPADAIRYTDALNAAMSKYEINTPKRIGAFLATVAVESAYLSKVEEGLYYRDPTRLLVLYTRAFKAVAEAEPYARNPKGLSELLYQGLHGRGLIQLTGRRNYEAFDATSDSDCVRNPDVLLQPRWAAESAAWFWHTNGCNTLADKSDMDGITRVVNGPKKLHLAERTAAYHKAMQWLA